MKDMIYTSKRSTREVLAEGSYKTYLYQIISYGTHPCAYVKIARNHPWFNKYYDDMNIDCHGGLTYGRHGHNDYWIGWDYSHYGDYNGSEEMFPEDVRMGGKKYTTEEIFEDVKHVIDQLEEVENEQV